MIKVLQYTHTISQGNILKSIHYNLFCNLGKVCYYSLLTFTNYIFFQRTHTHTHTSCSLRQQNKVRDYVSPIPPNYSLIQKNPTFNKSGIYPLLDPSLVLS
jgi:hypothetical protein